MKRMQSIAVGLVVLVMASATQAAIIGISTDKPTENIVAENTPGGAAVGFDAPPGSRFAWGQSFTVGAGGTVIDAISIKMANDTGFAYPARSGREMKIAIFEYDEATYTATTNRLGTFSDPFDGTNISSIYSEVFDTSMAVTNSRWVTFDLTTNQTLTNGTYAFMTWVTSPSGGTWVWGKNTDGASYSGGDLLRVYNGLDNQVYAQDLNFTIQAIPEPATLGLFAVCGAALLLIRRRLRA